MQQVYFDNNTWLLEPPSIVYTHTLGHGYSSSTISLSDRSGSEAVNIFPGFICLLRPMVLGVLRLATDI